VTRYDNANIRPCRMGEHVMFPATTVDPALAQ